MRNFAARASFKLYFTYFLVPFNYEVVSNNILGLLRMFTKLELNEKEHLAACKEHHAVPDEIAAPEIPASLPKFATRKLSARKLQDCARKLEVCAGIYFALNNYYYYYY